MNAARKKAAAAAAARAAADAKNQRSGPPPEVTPEAVPIGSRDAAGYPEMWRSNLRDLERRRREINDREVDIIRQAILAGATWTEVANVLGTRRQSAHQRFAKRIELRQSREP